MLQAICIGDGFVDLPLVYKILKSMHVSIHCEKNPSLKVIHQPIAGKIVDNDKI